jgi:hypothetical protein
VWVRQQRFVSHLDCVLPTFFNKRVSCLTGTNDPILVPYDSPMLDYEGELMAVIVKQAHSKSEGTITEVGLESVHVTRPKCCRGIGENLECRSGRSRTACIAAAHSRAEDRRQRENAKPEIEGPNIRSADCPGCVCLRLAFCPPSRCWHFGAGHLKWQDSSARDSQVAGVQSVQRRHG